MAEADTIANLADIFNKLCGTRNTFLDDAEEVARLTIPKIEPKGVKIDERPFTASGALAIRSISSFTVKTLMPTGINYVDLSLSKKIDAEVKKELGEDALKDVDARMQKLRDDVIESLREKNVRSRSIPAVRRNIIEGATGAFLDEGGIQFFPLRDLVVRRSKGKVFYAIFQEEEVPDPTEPETITAGSGDDRNRQRKMVHTEVDFINKKVRRQGPDDDAPKDIDSEEISAHQYFVFTAEVPDVADYTTGYAENYRPLFNQINLLELSLGQASAAAATVVPVARAGSVFADDPDILRRRRPGEIIAGAVPDDLGFITAGVKINEWSWVANMLAFHRDDLARAFAMGLKDRPLSEESATKTLAVIDELNEQTADLLSSYDETFLSNLVKAEIHLQNKIAPVFEDLDVDIVDITQVDVVTGASAFEIQKSLGKLIERWLPQIRVMDPTMLIDGVVLADKIGSTIPIKTAGMWTKAPMQQGMGGIPGQNGVASAPREETVLTPGGPQPPQMAPPAPG